MVLGDPCKSNDLQKGLNPQVEQNKGHFQKQLIHCCIFFFFFYDSVSLHSPGWPRTYYVDQADLELTESCLPLLGLKACAATTHHYSLLQT